MRRTRPALVVGLTALLAAVLAAPASAKGGPPATSGPGPDWQINHAQVAGLVAGIERGDATTVHGEIAGAAYVGQLPDDWNGRLLVWAHGYRGEFDTAPLLTVDPPPLFAQLVDDGTAWIASSYRRNSYDPGIGVIDTKNVTERAVELFGEPEHTYVAGVSMGGHVIGAAVEKYPDVWDGAMPVCGVMGDVELFDYFLDYNLAAAAFAEVPADYPDDDWLGDEVPQIKDALSDGGVPSWAYQGTLGVPGVVPSVLTPAGQTFKDFVEVGSGGVRGDLFPGFSIYDLAWDYWHLGANPTGDFFFALGEGDGTIASRAGIVGQNSDTVYAEEYGAAFAGLDDTIERVTAANRVRKGQGTKPAPIINGTPGIPVLTMHTIGDLFVPIEMQQIYAREVAANGLGDNLVQRAIRDVGHCTFSAGEWARGYADLFAWVEGGVVPGGDAFTDPGLLADPFLGWLWTDNTTPAPSGAVRVFGP